MAYRVSPSSWFAINLFEYSHLSGNYNRSKQTINSGNRFLKALIVGS